MNRLIFSSEGNELVCFSAGLSIRCFLLSAAAKAGSRRQADFPGAAGVFAPALRAAIVTIEVCIAVTMHITRIRSVSLLQGDSNV